MPTYYVQGGAEKLGVAPSFGVRCHDPQHHWALVPSLWGPPSSQELLAERQAGCPPGTVGGERSTPVQPLGLGPLLSGVALLSEEARPVWILAPLGSARPLALGKHLALPGP